MAARDGQVHERVATHAGEFRDGRRNGPWNFWHPDGSLDALHSGTYWDDVLTVRKRGASFA